LVAALALAIFGFPACSSDSGGGSEEACKIDGCLCIFASDCPEGMNCIDGHCASHYPTLDGWTLSDARVLVELLDQSADGSGGREADAEGDAIVNQPFGAPCTENPQCASGWCIESPDGGYCTRICEEGCPSGWVCKVIQQTYPDVISVCVVDASRLCLPCEIDSHCGDGGNLCLEIGGGSFCSRNCATAPCPTGYKCQEVTDGEITAEQCLPENGACDCNEDSVGLVRGCILANEFGTCLGQETCDPVVGWTGCDAQIPELEACDGLDNDCNGQVDGGFLPEPCEVENEWGKCAGEKSCQGAFGWVCSAKIPSAEKCNLIDDNCNGAADEDFLDSYGTYNHVENCGTCGNSCVAKVTGSKDVACDTSGEAPVCKILSCLPGYFLFNDMTCLDEDYFLCQPCTTDSDCFGGGSKCLQVSPTDPRTFCFRDCSGLGEFSKTCPAGYSCKSVEDSQLCIPDNSSCDCSEGNVGQVKACSLENEFGLCFGQETCDPELGWTGCSALSAEPETCDGVDNDCDGPLDESLPPPESCTTANEWGECDGQTYCAGAEGMLCSAPEAEAESCDGKDNDCNGKTDDGFAVEAGDPPVLKYGLSAQHCGTCNHECPAIDHGTTKCDPLPAIPQCIVDECEPGYFDFQGIACLPVPDANLCIPCGLDTDCQGPDDLCIQEGQGQGYCGRDCGPGSVYGTLDLPCSGKPGLQGCCPGGYVCLSAGGSMQCRPLSGTCTCIKEGKVAACSNANADGTCYGLSTCHTEGDDLGWTPCTASTPLPEICDGLDNDCDGIVDGQDSSLDFSTTPDKMEACSHGPACKGSWSCVDQTWICTAKPAAPEVCNGLDDDCDGNIDQSFMQDGKYLHVSNCGACGYDCALLIPNSSKVACQLIANSPTCVATECDPGFFPYAGGTVCLALPDNLCHPCSADDDCLVPSSKCLALGAEKACGRDCSPTGPFGPDCPAGFSCQQIQGASQCKPLSGTCICGPETEGLVRYCTAGACIGKQVCQKAGELYVFSPCSPEGVIPEVCDGKDNDCDGNVDEGFLSPDGKYTADENCGICGNNCLTQFSEAVHHATGKCNTKVNPPACAVKSCSVETVGGVTYEWVDVNGIADDGCECKRTKGNLLNDDPDDDFYPVGSQTPAYPDPTAAYADANCDGIDGVMGEAMFVSAGNPLPGNGTFKSPFQTINQAIAAFPASGKKYVLVAGGLYQENPALISGIQLHGGYAPNFSTRNIVLFPTEIRGVEPDFSGNPKQGTVYAANLKGPAKTVVSGFMVVGYDVSYVPASGNGKNSYAFWISDCAANLEIRNCLIVGGMGGAGITGLAGANGFGAESTGGVALNGKNGLHAGACAGGKCAGLSQAGGAGGQNAGCAGANGPNGGSVVCPVYNTAAYTPPNPGHDGDSGWNWTLDGYSSGSCYSHATEAGYPTAIKKMDGGDGHPGSDGKEGLQGAGCAQANGAFVNGHWSGNAGAAGATGAVGQAGGAGGASGGIDSAAAAQMPPGVPPKPSPQYKLGATGGGGGAGGCGGQGGTGGTSGGASIGLLVTLSTPSAVSSLPTVQANLFQRGYGGPGGTGGYGGKGGKGGEGGIGGDSQGYWIDFEAGEGGRGGIGGEGGGGGGGGGGASVSVAVAGHSATWKVAYDAANQFVQPETVLTGGSGGQPGPSGLSNPAGKGTQGLTKNLFSVPAP
jgi:hypothetical protein